MVQAAMDAASLKVTSSVCGDSIQGLDAGEEATPNDGIDMDVRSLTRLEQSSQLELRPS